MRIFRQSPSPSGDAGTRSTPEIRIRKLPLNFDAIPRHWFSGNAWVTQVANGLNLVFPAGERFFIRSVKHYLPQLTDPKLRARVRAFFGQEGAHGHAHEQAFEVLERQGFEVQRWLRWYEKLAFERLEPRFPPSVRLATTVALEHFTATLAERAFTTDFLDHADPAMRKLLRWHAAEEIEHKSVAFDVFEAVDGRYHIRVVGLLIAAIGLMAFWRSATAMLLAQETSLSAEELKRLEAEAKANGHSEGFLLESILAYLRPGFHPDDHDNYHLAERFLQELQADTAA